MIDESILQRLSEGVRPDAGAALRMKNKVLGSIQPQNVLQSVQSVVPTRTLRASLKDRILARIQSSPVASTLGELAESFHLPSDRALSLREMILSRLSGERQVSFLHGGLKWGAAFALFLLMIRAMPLVFLAPATKADIGVQLLPSGEQVSVFIGGVWRDVDSPEVVKGPLMIRTGDDSRATIILNDDGVLRLEPDTTFKLHDVLDRPHMAASSPTATLVRGTIWVLGLLPPVVESISIETEHGEVDINSGSASLSEDGTTMTVAVYDRGAIFRHREQTAFLISGEKAAVNASVSFSIVTMPETAFTAPFVVENLKQDAVHRAEIAASQQERRERMAGILPTSILYPAKRIAEKVDVLFTLTHDGRTEKLIQQADTRLNEALALINDGQSTEAVISLGEYHDALVSMASGTGDNIVKYLIKKQIADATLSMSPSTSSGTIGLFRSAVVNVSAAIPDTSLRSKDIEGYVLVDKLTEINHLLSVEHNLTGALLAYADVSPYLGSLLHEEDGAHPLLQKEAKSLLVSTAALLKEESKGVKSKILIAAETDLDQYLPPEQDSLLLSETELNSVIDAILGRIFIFKAPLSRYNQLLLEMSELRGNPNRGTLLRRLYRALPENGLGGYVLTEIKNFGDELKAR